MNLQNLAREILQSAGKPLSLRRILKAGEEDGSLTGPHPTVEELRAALHAGAEFAEVRRGIFGLVGTDGAPDAAPAPAAAPAAAPASAASPADSGADATLRSPQASAERADQSDEESPDDRRRRRRRGPSAAEMVGDDPSAPLSVEDAAAQVGSRSDLRRQIWEKMQSRAAAVQGSGVSDADGSVQIEGAQGVATRAGAVVAAKSAARPEPADAARPAAAPSDDASLSVKDRIASAIRRRRGPESSVGSESGAESAAASSPSDRGAPPAGPSAGPEVAAAASPPATAPGSSSSMPTARDLIREKLRGQRADRGPAAAAAAAAAEEPKPTVTESERSAQVPTGRAPSADEPAAERGTPATRTGDAPRRERAPRRDAPEAAAPETPSPIRSASREAPPPGSVDVRPSTSGRPPRVGTLEDARRRINDAEGPVPLEPLAESLGVGLGPLVAAINAENARLAEADLPPTYLWCDRLTIRVRRGGGQALTRLSDALAGFERDTRVHLARALADLTSTGFEAVLFALLRRLGHQNLTTESRSASGELLIVATLSDDEVTLVSAQQTEETEASAVARAHALIEALDKRDADEGVLLTLGRFGSAVDAVVADDDRVRLVDGADVARLMAVYGVGVVTTRPPVRYVDLTAFEALR